MANLILARATTVKNKNQVVTEKFYERDKLRFRMQPEPAKK